MRILKASNLIYFFIMSLTELIGSLQKPKTYWDEDGFSTEEGMMYVKTIYDKVNSYDDLLLTGIEYLKGNIFCTPYVGAPICEETYEIVDDLIELHKYGFYSTGSQPYKYKDRNNWQIPYLSGMTKKKFLGDLVIYLSTNTDIYYFIADNNNLRTNFPKKMTKLCVTMDAGKEFSFINPRFCNFRDEKDLFHEFKNIKTMIKNELISIVICGREIKDINLQKILLDFYKSIKF